MLEVETDNVSIHGCTSQDYTINTNKIKQLLRFIENQSFLLHKKKKNFYVNIPKEIRLYAILSYFPYDNTTKYIQRKNNTTNIICNFAEKPRISILKVDT